jgi:hypothetical protein
VAADIYPIVGAADEKTRSGLRRRGLITFSINASVLAN